MLKQVFLILIGISVSAGCFAQGDVCKISSINNAVDLGNSLQCMKTFTTQMKQVLGETNNELKKQFDFLDQLLIRETDCMFVEKTFQYKQRGLPYNRGITESQRASCERDSREFAIRFSAFGKTHWKLVDNSNLSQETIDAYEIKMRELDSLLTQVRVK